MARRGSSPALVAPRSLARTALVIASIAGLAVAQTRIPTDPLAPASPASPFDGRTFGGVDIPAAPQNHELTLAADRTWTWRDENTERLLLDRNVRVTLGPYSFQAKRCVAWIEPIRIDGADAEQIALYFDRVSDAGGAPVAAASAERLLVTAVISRPGANLRTDVLREGRPDDAFITDAEGRLSRYLTSLVAPPVTLPAPGSQPAPTGDPTVPPATITPPWVPADDRGLPPAERIPAEYPARGLVNFFAQNIQSLTSVNPGERAILLTGGVAVQYAPQDQGIRPSPPVQISAERAVAFLSENAEAGATRYDVGDVLGVYLEGDVVATTGQYTLRGSRVFYDVRTDRAVVLDAVFWTYDEQRGMPIYMRASAIRQETRDQWNAKDVRLANVGFAEPSFAIGATDVTVTRAPRAPGDPGPARTTVAASDVTFRFGDTPMLYLPGVEGELRPSPLRLVSIDSEGGDPILRTGWDLYTILGLDAAEGNRATLLLDGYFNRGPAAGIDAGWRTQDIVGNLFAYGIYDDGTDQLPSGGEVKQDNEFRGVATADQIWRLSEEWTLFLEGSYISDETFIPAFFRSEAEERREYITSLYARRLDDNTGFEFEARGTFNDFITNQYLLQSQGYTTEKLPEVAYHRLNDDLFDGVVSWSSDYSVSAMRLAMNEPTNRELGYRTLSKSRAAFGLTPDQSIAEELRAQGFTEDDTYRADTRQDFEIPLRAGELNIVPFFTGRATAWDDNFDEFNGDDNDPYRLWGASGLRLATTIQRIDDSAKLEALDINRIRHIIEPSATVWHASTNVNQEDLPVYDEEVEGIAQGTAARIGVRNTLQTYRGGPDAQRSVDLLVVDTNYLWSSTEVDPESPYGRFIEARPERSQLGEFASNEIVFAVTDALSITNSVLYDVDNASLARTTVGGIIDHGFGFSTLVEYRYLDDPRATLLDAAARYELTRKYAAILSGTYDVERSEFQSAGMRIERRFPQWTVDFRIDVDNVTNDVSVGVALRPAGLAGENRRRVFSRDLADQPVVRKSLPERERLEYGPFAE